MQDYLLLTEFRTMQSKPQEPRRTIRKVTAETWGAFFNGGLLTFIFVSKRNNTERRLPPSGEKRLPLAEELEKVQ